MANYCEKANIEQIFGTTNVATWSTMASTDTTAIKEARITYACAVATEMVNDVARVTPYAVPLQDASGNAPASIVYRTAQLAGVVLYEARGVDDVDPRSGQPRHRLQFIREDVQRWMEQFRTGQLKIDAVEGT